MRWNGSVLKSSHANAICTVTSSAMRNSTGSSLLTTGLPFAPCLARTAFGKSYLAMIAAAPDLTKTPPRSGREMLGRYAWLARLADKVRAEHADTQGEYVAYCPLSMGFLERAGVTGNAFDLLVEQGLDDEKLVEYFDNHVSDEQRDAANRYILQEHREALDEEDAEEGRG